MPGALTVVAADRALLSTLVDGAGETSEPELTEQAEASTPL
jgi:hypothetical protein